MKDPVLVILNLQEVETKYDRTLETTLLALHRSGFCMSEDLT